ncbi:response regulator [Desulfallas sp. Bu1-1]|nr:response regulator [Desulfallas sp. Bu1-1]
MATNYPNIPVIMMSMERKKESVLKCIDLGAKDYLLKPFDKETLISRIERFYHVLLREQVEDTDLKDLDNTLLLEVDRANRAGTSLTVLSLKIKSQNILKRNNIIALKNNLKKILRKLDNVYAYNGYLVLILPLTNKDGFEVVKNKIVHNFNQIGISFSEEINLKIFFYPDDVHQKELINNYNSNAIKDLILNKLMDTNK